MLLAEERKERAKNGNAIHYCTKCKHQHMAFPESVSTPAGAKELRVVRAGEGLSTCRTHEDRKCKQDRSSNISPTKALSR